MASKVSLFNSALQRLGTGRVSTDTETTTEAEALDAVYDETLLFLLEQHPWSFARTSVELSRLVATPETVWTYFYDLPSDIVKILRVSDGPANLEWQTGPSVPYERQDDDRIATDAETVYLFYVKSVTDPNQMTPSFRDALAWRLAFEVGYRLTESTTKVESCEGRYFQALENAKSHDSARSRIRYVNPTSWVTSRIQGTSGNVEGG